LNDLRATISAMIATSSENNSNIKPPGVGPASRVDRVKSFGRFRDRLPACRNY
jgi:hypothetical protein